MAVTTAPADIGISLDVSDIDASCAFYDALLGFRTVSSERAGLIYERRHLRSAQLPSLELQLRAAFGKRPIGSTPGSMLAITLRVTDVRVALGSLAAHRPIRWVGPAPAAEGPLAHATIADPDGYVLELVA